jgi:Fic family protein
MDFYANIDTIRQELETLRPLAPEQVDAMRRYYRIGLTYTSNAIEGSTLTESETRVVVEDGLTVNGKPLSDHLVAVGHAHAVDWLWQEALHAPITESTVTTFYRLLFDGQADIQSGQYRTSQVFIQGDDYLPPHHDTLPALMDHLFTVEWPHWQKTLHSVHAAILLHWKLVTIHPFADGNGRVARLVMNTALMQEGYGITHVPPVSRVEYIRSLAASRDVTLSIEGAQPFVEVMLERVYESLKDYLRYVRHIKG